MIREGGESGGHAASPAKAIPLAVLGDSNSHSYHDSLSFPPQAGERGGAWRANTLQWTEVVNRLRGDELSLGPWVRWGYSGRVTRIREWLGLSVGRAPEKEDYLYNFANSGATCTDLMRGRFRQAPRLVALMNKQPDRWARGVVVIRMGLNDWKGMLDVQARDPSAPELNAAINFCAAEVSAAIQLIHAAYPSTSILLVGIGNEADDPSQLDHYRTASDTANLAKALGRFNGALEQLTRGDPRIAFFDDDAWFRKLWGSRDGNGEPAYKTVTLGSGLSVTNTAGNEPGNALLEDLHAGLAWNALWAQSLVARLREAFDLPLTPISGEELDRFLLPLVKQPIAPGS